MKKFLLVAFAALFVGSANAQFAKKQIVGKPQASKTHRVLPQATAKKYEAVPAKQVKAVANKTVKQLQVTSALTNSLKPVVKPINKVARAAAVQAVYEGYGTDLQEGPVAWEMYTGTDEDGTTLLIQDVIPDPFGFENGVVVEYTQSGNDIVIAPQLVASNSAGTMFVYLIDASSADGSITLTMDNDGNIIGTYDILYGAFSQQTTDMNNMDLYLGYYSYVQNVKYNVPGDIVTPTVSFEPGNLVLFAGLGMSGYSYNNNLSMTSAYAPVSFRNITTDKVTEWQWSATRTSMDDEEETLTSDEKDFVINTVGLDTYNNISLVGVNQTATSEAFKFGLGKSAEYDGYDAYLYAGGTQYQFEFSDGTYATMTRQDPDGVLKFYTNWGTPDIYTTSMSKIYNYFEKPATPLYIEGITLPVVSGNYSKDFNLHVKIYEVDYTGSRPILGRILAEGDATIDNVDQSYSSGLSAINFNDLYVEDEIGMSESLPFLHIDTEFMVVIEGWDNGTFSGVLGSQDAPLDNARRSTWFEKTGEEGSMYSYTGWNTSLFVGLIGATYGWMHTEDDTNVALPAEGGQATIHIADSFYPAEYTWLDDDTEEVEWLDITLNPGETDYDFDLVFTAAALPEGTTGREAEITFVQWGAKLTVKVTQGEATGITTTVVKIINGKAYDLSGRQAKAGQKGLIIRDGKKFIVK